MKSCPGCGRPHPRDAFVTLAGARSPRAKYCEQCQPGRSRSGPRAFDFNEPVKREVIGRQLARCGVCGGNFMQNDAMTNFHHVVPNQAGNPSDPADHWLREPDNCVLVCEPCHDAAHDSNTTSGAMAPPSFFPYSHGGDAIAHADWVREHSKRTPSRWR